MFVRHAFVVHYRFSPLPSMLFCIPSPFFVVSLCSGCRVLCFLLNLLYIHPGRLLLCRMGISWFYTRWKLVVSLIYWVFVVLVNIIDTFYFRMVLASNCIIILSFELTFCGFLFAFSQNYPLPSLDTSTSSSSIPSHGTTIDSSVDKCKVKSWVSQPGAKSYILHLIRVSFSFSLVDPPSSLSSLADAAHSWPGMGCWPQLAPRLSPVSFWTTHSLRSCSPRWYPVLTWRMFKS